MTLLLLTAVWCALALLTAGAFGVVCHGARRGEEALAARAPLPHPRTPEQQAGLDEHHTAAV